MLCVATWVWFCLTTNYRVCGLLRLLGMFPFGCSPPAATGNLVYGDRQNDTAMMMSLPLRNAYHPLPTTAAGPQRLTPTRRPHYNKKGGRARRRTYIYIYIYIYYIKYRSLSPLSGALFFAAQVGVGLLCFRFHSNVTGTGPPTRPSPPVL